MDTFAGCDDVESCKEVVVGNGSDELGHGHCLVSVLLKA